MESIKLNDIVKACNGEFTGDKSLLDTYIKNISTDSRDISEDCLFIPLVGDIYDGHDYIETAFNNGCVSSVITSYSIHYTKLYDAPIHAAVMNGAMKAPRLMPI